jgi:hypothetical protein
VVVVEEVMAIVVTIVMVMAGRQDQMKEAHKEGEENGTQGGGFEEP